MVRGRLPRHLDVDWPRRRDDRVPILEARPTFEFGEPAYAELDGRHLEGLIGWDPSLGWVLNIPPDRPGAPIDTDEGFE
jgi:hypothetical protein